MRAFGKEQAARIMGNVTQLTYDGEPPPAAARRIPAALFAEAIPET